MNNLTSILLDTYSDLKVEEYVRQGQAVVFDSGKEQRVVGGSIPSLEIQITYNNIDADYFEALRLAYEENYANTFICKFDDNIDMRSLLMTDNAEVYMFKEFEFTADARSERYRSGRITLLSSIFFNFPEYQNLFSQSSSYTPNITTDTSFTDVLDDAPAYQVTYKYSNQSIGSNIGASGRHIKDKGIKKVWTMRWLLPESDFLKLLMFNRKKAGIMGDFGIYSDGYSTDAEVEDNYVEWEDYLEDYLLYNDWYLYINHITENLIKARFVNDSFKYNKRIDGLYTCEADFIEVKNG